MDVCRMWTVKVWLTCSLVVTSIYSDSAVSTPGNLHHITSSCTGHDELAWNRQQIRLQLEERFDSLQPVRDGQQIGAVQERHYDRISGKYQDQQTNISYKTIGKGSGSLLQGLAWQWRGDHSIDGFLYGRLDSIGRFTGDNITFLYPDMLTGKL